MAKQQDDKETASFKQLLLSNAYQQEAMLNILERKGLISKQEVLDEIKRLYANKK